MALVLRRRRDGGLRVVGDAPAEHTFASAFIARGLAEGYVRVSVALVTDAGEVTYDLEQLASDDDTPNATAWRAVRADAERGKRGRRAE